MDKPRITVLMPVYNGQKYLVEAIDSILKQTFTDFELLFVNDGSSDGSLKIIQSYADKRIRLINNPRNLGLVASLNIGLAASRGEYIARMDQDDVALPERLFELISFMERHPHIAVCGSWVRTIGTIKGYVNKVLDNSDDIRANLLFYTSMVHPTVMIKKSDLDELDIRYDPINEYCEDYGLWVALSETKGLANIPKVLLLYRVHGESLSRTYPEEQKSGASRIRRRQLERLGLYPDDLEIRLHNSLFPAPGQPLMDYLSKEEEWLLKIRSVNQKVRYYNPSSLSEVLYQRWKTVCGMNARDMSVWRTFIKSPLYRGKTKRKYVDSLKIGIKCIISLYK